jgi:hypothetical protein
MNSNVVLLFGDQMRTATSVFLQRTGRVVQIITPCASCCTREPTGTGEECGTGSRERTYMQFALPIAPVSRRGD